jgi:hypothetical protein
VSKMERGLPPNGLVPALRADVDLFRCVWGGAAPRLLPAATAANAPLLPSTLPLSPRRQLLPVASALRNPALREHDRARIVEAVEAAGGQRLEAAP